MRMTVPIRSGALLLLLPALASGAEPEDCPRERRIAVDLRAWKRSLQKAPSGSKVQRQALAELGFPPGLLTGEHGPVTGCEAPPQVEGVDLFTAPLSGAAKPDTVVQVRMRVCPDSYQESATLQHIAVLRPRKAGGHCRLGGDSLSWDQRLDDEPCSGEATKWPRTFAFVELVTPGRKALEVRDQGGRCEGPYRAVAYWKSYWVADAESVREVFRQQTEDGSYRSVDPGSSQVRRATVTLEGGLPRSITVTETVECGSSGDEAAGEESGEETERSTQTGCTPGTTRTRFEWNGSHYVPAASQVPPAPAKPGSP
jgi:hypothetical protein